MATSLQALLDERAAGLGGRDRERALLLDLVEPGRPPIAYVHGLAGVGKSALLDAFAQDARRRGALVLRLACAGIEPTARGLLDALGDALGQPLGDVPDAAAALAAVDGPVVVVLDPFERLQLIDAWVRQSFVPALPGNARVLLAARDGAAGWRRDFGELVRILRLENLAPADALEVLARDGVDAATAARVNAIAHGHPLSLRLAAAALAETPGLHDRDAAVERAVEVLAGVYLAGLDPVTRRALDAAAVVRRATMSLLEAMLPGDDPALAFERLRALPFCSLAGDGLEVHDAVRAACDALLRSADPARRRRMRRAAWAQLRTELRTAAGADHWRYTADMLYLVEHPVVRDAFFPPRGETGDLAIEPARPDDGPAIAAISAEFEPPAATALTRDWWAAAPFAFHVLRDEDGTLQGYTCFIERQEVPRSLLSSDPLAAVWREHQRRAPLPTGSRVLYCPRHGVARPFGEGYSPAQARLWLDSKRRYLELRPQLRRLYVGTLAPAMMLEALGPLGFRRVEGDPVDIDGVPYASLYLEFGSGSVDGWLADVVGRELQADEEGRLDVVARRLSLDGRDIELTRLECDVLALLERHVHQAVTRDTLLQEVWGYEWTGGSNVVEVVVSSLRRKLGPRASALETVRGVGYRLRELR